MDERFNQAAEILGNNRFLVHKHDPRMMLACFSPAFEQWSKGSLVVGNKR